MLKIGFLENEREYGSFFVLAETELSNVFVTQ